ARQPPIATTRRQRPLLELSAMLAATALVGAIVYLTLIDRDALRRLMSAAAAAITTRERVSDTTAKAAAVADAQPTVAPAAKPDIARANGASREADSEPFDAEKDKL